MKDETEPIDMNGICIWAIIAVVSAFLFSSGSDVMRYFAGCFSFLALLGLLIATREKKYTWFGKTVEMR
jgi:hypothetical protein